MSFSEKFRDNVPLTHHLVYLNHAAISPTPLPVYLEVNKYLMNVMLKGTIAVNEEESDDFYHIREKIGKLINAEPNTISLIPNTSYGINIVAHGIDLKKGENVVTDNIEFPATVYPFIKISRIKGVELRIARASPETIEDDIISKIDGNTRIVSLSHVSFSTGVKVDVNKIVKEARRVGAYVLLDIIQSAGATEVDVKNLDIDFAVAGGYKWLMSPQGSGFFYVKKGLLEDPPFYGWKTSSIFLEFDPERFYLERGPRRFEIGTIDVASNLGLAKSCEIINQNKEEIFNKVSSLSSYVIKLAKENNLEVITPEKKKAGIVVIKMSEPKRITEYLSKKKMIVSPRGKGIRISTHFYNTYEEVDKLMEEIRKYSQEFS
ncbi:aminotransferase class V-fold PLP-dependent enzyme [Stygiolobus caldivivus]|uniref:Cysteine desulfurase n=1 Tax=Stygiolobus caldivivus TaxID=2824673 RepID=A0A8D5U545_9CREN|nr:aminotransferase class V-fold PLP-dependent enzyme [Stygiolobus caldivivus]BCU69263.1 cysteine desulfurase [Stygiolobus caldivivus]